MGLLSSTGPQCPSGSIPLDDGVHYLERLADVKFTDLRSFKEQRFQPTGFYFSGAPKFRLSGNTQGTAHQYIFPQCCYQLRRAPSKHANNPVMSFSPVLVLMLVLKNASFVPTSVAPLSKSSPNHAFTVVLHLSDLTSPTFTPDTLISS